MRSSSNIRDKMREIKNSLTWKVKHKRAGYYGIFCDPWTRTHIIHIQSGEDLCNIVYLHELIYAVLAERHNHLFATAYFCRKTQIEDYKALVTPYRIAVDWFVEDLLMRLCPEEMWS